MAALVQSRGRSQEAWKFKVFTLKSGTKAFKSGAACIEKATGKVVPGTSGAGLVWIGMFAEDVDATSADTPVNVDLMREVTLEWLENDTTTPVVATDVMSNCYTLDDHTVTGAPAGNSVSGIVWAVSASKGVLVERAPAPSSPDRYMQIGAALTYTSNDAAPTSIVSGAEYDVPTTAAASTITLPPASPDGTWAVFTADGTKNGHTITYRDATGPTNLTTALTASKRHMTRVQKMGGKWFANAYVSP